MCYLLKGLNLSPEPKALVIKYSIYVLLATLKQKLSKDGFRKFQIMSSVFLIFCFIYFALKHKVQYCSLFKLNMAQRSAVSAKGSHSQLYFPPATGSITGQQLKCIGQILQSESLEQFVSSSLPWLKDGGPKHMTPL